MKLLDALGDDAGLEGAEREECLRAISRDRGPSGYAFRCRRCGALGGYQDMD